MAAPSERRSDGTTEQLNDEATKDRKYIRLTPPLPLPPPFVPDLHHAPITLCTTRGRKIFIGVFRPQPPMFPVLWMENPIRLPLSVQTSQTIFCTGDESMLQMI